MPMKESGIRIIGTRIITRYQQRNQRQYNNTLQYDVHAHSTRKCLDMFHQLYFKFNMVIRVIKRTWEQRFEK